MIGRRRGMLPRRGYCKLTRQRGNAPTGRAYEWVAALATARYLQDRAARGDRALFERALAHVADVEPLPEDGLIQSQRFTAEDAEGDNVG